MVSVTSWPRFTKEPPIPTGTRGLVGHSAGMDREVRGKIRLPLSGIETW
jgi:hypothetical protein